MTDNIRELPRCGETKADGSPCERIVGASQSYCYSHDPNRANDRRKSASTAGKSKLSSEIISIRSEIREIMEGIREEDIDKGAGSVLLQGCGLLLKAVAEGRKQSEYDEVRSEMAELRELFESQTESRHYG